jgi:YggT family protein
MFLTSIAAVLDLVLGFFMFLFIAAAVLSWVSPDPSNPIVQFIYSATEPILYRIRKRVPPLGMLDLSVLVALLLIFFLRSFLVGALTMYGNQLIAH